MTNEMIERVARTLFVELGWEGVGAHPSFEEDQGLWLEAARAAIEAMREPTEAMRFKGCDQIMETAPTHLVWQAMIDEALR